MSVGRIDDGVVNYHSRGDVVSVEIEERDGDFRSLRPDRPVASFDRVFQPVSEAAAAAMRALRETQPDEVTIHFGIKVTGSGQAVVAKNTTDAHFEITLSWRPGDRPAPNAEGPLR
ncbi:CU044_2847 family protein [Streptomyces sp. NPDC050504]|uniref:CU044_2847 family protein n=1 Tax=Streptomyces sp. NPDC050504 TaxID=3365618 RepID=UPI00379EA537